MKKLLFMLLFGFTTIYSMQQIVDKAITLKKLPLLAHKPVLSCDDTVALYDEPQQPYSLIALCVQSIIKGISNDAIDLENLIEITEKYNDYANLIYDEIRKNPSESLFLLHDAKTVQKAASLIRLKNMLNLNYRRKNFYGQTPFNTHICNNRPTIALTLLQLIGNDLDITTQDMHKKSPLQNAIIRKFKRVAATILKQLIERKKLNHINTQNCRAESTFDLALRYAPELLSSLIATYKFHTTKTIEQHINQLKNRGNYKETLLMATLYNQFDLVDEHTWSFINHPHAFYDKETEYSLLMIAILKKIDPRVIQRLLDNNAQINVCNVKRQTPLTYAVKTNQPKIVHKLLKRNADASIICNGTTLVELTIDYCPSVIGTLLGYLEDRKKELINFQNENGDTPLHIAIKNNDLNAIMTLCIHNADGYISNKKGVNCIHYASSISSLAFFTLLFPFNTDQQNHIIDLQDAHGRTPLMWAVKGNRKDNVEQLLQAGADATIKDINGKTVFDRAHIKGTQEIVTLLEKNQGL
jgi:ankyrin repeat protein